MDTMDWDIKRYEYDELRYYNLYKYDNTHAVYVIMNISKYQRSLFAQFRSRSLPQEIEIGRYMNIPLELCDTRKILKYLSVIPNIFTTFFWNVLILQVLYFIRTQFDNMKDL